MYVRSFRRCRTRVAALAHDRAGASTLIVERDNALHVPAVQPVGSSQFVLLSENGFDAKLEQVLSEALRDIVADRVGRNGIRPRRISGVDVEAM